MATPSLQQARSHYERQRRIVAAAVVAVRKLFKRQAPILEIASTVSAYQFASATASANTVAGFADSSSALTVPRVFAGVSSYGFPIAEPIVATIDRIVPAPVEAIPANWWTDAEPELVRELEQAVEQLIASEIQDAGRTASQVEFVARPDWQNYVRMLNPPSCARCAILAGRIYRDLDHFDRHPLCDCVMIPVQNWQAAHDMGLVSSAQDLIDKGQLGTHRTLEDGSKKFEPGLSKADMQALHDGADIGEVVNARRAGLRAPAGVTNAITTDLFGRRVKATLNGTTRRAAWRRANPTRLVRLRPEAIYQIVDREYGGDRDQATRLLKLYGYIK